MKTKRPNAKTGRSLCRRRGLRSVPAGNVDANPPLLKMCSFEKNHPIWWVVLFSQRRGLQSVPAGNVDANPPPLKTDLFKKTTQTSGWSYSYNGEGGIRTHDTLRYTRFPSGRTRPTMRPLHTAFYKAISIIPDTNRLVKWLVYVFKC